MKKRIIIITIALLVAGTAVLGFDILSLTPEEAYEAASSNNLQREIDELNHELKAMNLEDSMKNAKYTAINTYQGNIIKYVTPFDSETNFTVSEMNLAKSEKQLMVTIYSSMVSLQESIDAFGKSREAYDEALAEYEDALSDSTLPAAELLSLEYSAESKRISMLQAQQNRTKKQNELDGLLGMENARVELSKDYSSPYEISPEEVYEAAMDADISLYQSKRLYESAEMRHEIAADFFDEEDETYISTLSSMKSAELNYNMKLAALEASVLDKTDNLKTLYDYIGLEKLNVDLKREMYSAAKKQYDAGIVSINSLEASEEAYESAQKQLDSRIYTYIIACMQFEIDTGYELLTNN